MITSNKVHGNILKVRPMYIVTDMFVILQLPMMVMVSKDLKKHKDSFRYLVLLISHERTYPKISKPTR